MVQELVQIRFRRRAQLVGGAMYLPGEVASVTPEQAAQLCAENDNPTATLVTTSLDGPPLDKMARHPEQKKERSGGHHSR